MRADKIIAAFSSGAELGRRLGAFADRAKPLHKNTISRWKKEGIPPLWALLIKKHYRELGLKTADLMDCRES
jgi:hypothetical protein